MPDQNASFIPKNANRVERRTRGTHRIYLLSYLSYVFFFGTLIAVVAIYFYGIQVEAQLKNVKSDLDAARSRFSDRDIETVRALEKRLLSVNQLLGEAAAPSRIFADIESVASSDIQFSAFKYERLPGQEFKVTLEGKAEDFNQMLYQRDLMEASTLFKNADVVEYDYNLAEAGGDNSNGLQTLPKGQAVLSFLFSDTLSVASIPYVPEEPEVEAVVENVVTAVSGTASTTEDASVEAAATTTSGT